MWLTKRMRQWLARRHSHSSKAAERRRRKKAVPLLERLEDRTLLAYTATVVGTTVFFTGDATADALIFDVDAAGRLRHNRFAAGDASFASEIDLNTVSGGVQSLNLAEITTLNVLAGDGNDVVSLNNGLLPVPSILGGQGGNDRLVGGSANDFLEGGAGNDILQGMGGNDVLDGDAGADQMYGGDDADSLLWDPGDGSDLAEGGNGTNTLAFNGASINDTFALTANGSRMRFDRQPGNIVIDTAGVRQVDINRDFVFASTLNGTNEVPPNPTTTATGTGTARFNTLTNTIDVDLTVNGIAASDITMTHIHVGAIGVDGGIILDLLALASYVDRAGSLRLTIRGAAFPAANVTDLITGNTYFNVHTTAFPGGEIRGQLIATGAGTASTFGADTFTVNDLSSTEVRLVRLDQGSVDAAAADIVAVNGRPAADNVNVSVRPGNVVVVNGLAAEVQIGKSEAGADQLIVNGNEGDDRLLAEPNVTATVGLTLDGGAGNDTVTGGGTLVGGDGHDTLTGGDGNDVLLGDGGSPFVLGLTVNNELVRFAAVNPGIILSTTAITGLQTGEVLHGIDFRPATGQLYALGITGGNTGRLYTVNSATGAATLVGAGPFSTTLTGTSFGFDFNPVPDRIRVVSDTEVSLRLHPDTGALVATDTPLSPAGNVVGSAYDRSFTGTAATTLFGIDSGSDMLVRQGGIDGNPSPNAGALTNIGALGVDTSDLVGFDIAAGSGTALASLTVGGISSLFGINLRTGAAGLVGTIGGAGAANIRGLAVIPASGNDLLSGGAGNDRLDGGAGNDVLDGGSSSNGNNIVHGGAGFDTLLVLGTPGPDVIAISQSGNLVTVTVNGVVGTNAAAAADQPNSIELISVSVLAESDAVTLTGLTVAAHTANPALDADQRFVEALFVKFLNRFATTSDLTFWASQFPTRGRTAVARDIVRSPEGLTVLVKGLYQTFLGRAAVGGEEQGHVQLLLSGQTEEQVTASILGSQEFFNRAQTLISSGTADERFVQALFNLLLNRTANAGDLAFWVGQIPSLGRTGIAAAFLGSLEHRRIRVNQFYLSLLNRKQAPSAAEVDAWAGSAFDLLEIKVRLASSQEFYVNG